jgi:hypothetical protein
MSDINHPPAVPLTRPNQIQREFFPFAAFSFDDPNVVATPSLILSNLWKLIATVQKYKENQKAISIVTATPNVVLVLSDALCDTYDLSGTCGTNATLTLYPPDADGYGVKTFRIINRVVSDSATPYTLTVMTGVAGKNTVVLTIPASGGAYSTRIVTVDSAGNVW